MGFLWGGRGGVNDITVMMKCNRICSKGCIYGCRSILSSSKTRWRFKNMLFHTCKKKQNCRCAETNMSNRSSGQHDLALEEPLGGPIHRDGLDAGSTRTHPDVGEHCRTHLSDTHFAPHSGARLLLTDV